MMYMADTKNSFIPRCAAGADIEPSAMVSCPSGLLKVRAGGLCQFGGHSPKVYAHRRVDGAEGSIVVSDARLRARIRLQGGQGWA